MDLQQIKQNLLEGQLVLNVIKRVLPKVNRELKFWWTQTGNCPDEQLRRQAQNSVKLKRFHCQGGSVYSLCSRRYENNLIKAIVAYQTISDYLDNLCDRVAYHDETHKETAFATLHHALTDALDIDKTPHNNYYEFYSHQNDGGYLYKLVTRCRQEIKHLPSYPLVKEEVLKSASLYNNLQVYKHLPLEKREPALTNWLTPLLEEYPEVTWWELAAATGSTLVIFALLAAAAKPDLTKEEVRKITDTYFPWICGLHILLDYFIDQEEDRQGGDLNFVFYYEKQEIVEKRLKLFVNNAYNNTLTLHNPFLPKTIIKGLLALYLSDPKVKKQGLDIISRKLIKRGGNSTRWMYSVCKMLRAGKII